MEPLYAISVQPEKFTHYTSYYFEKGQTKDTVKGILDWFKLKGLIFESWCCEIAYDHWYDSGGDCECYDSEEEFLDSVMLSACDYMTLCGKTRKSGSWFQLIIHKSNMSSHLEVKGHDWPKQGCESWNEGSTVYYKLVDDYPEF